MFEDDQIEECNFCDDIMDGDLELHTCDGDSYCVACGSEFRISLRED